MGGGIRAKCESDLGCGLTEYIENDAGLNARVFFLFVDLENGVHVLTEIENDRHVAALPRETSAASAREDGSADLATSGDGLNDILAIARDDDSDGNLAIVGTV